MNPNSQQGGIVDLVDLVSNEFGISKIVALQQIRASVIEIDGEPYTGKDVYSVPIAVIRGREIAVIGPVYHWKLRYPKE